MFRFSMGLLAGLGLSGLLGTRLAALPPLEAYPAVKPVSRRNVGRNPLKSGRGRYLPHQGEREIAHRQRQLAAGQIRFIQHGPRS